MSTACGKLTAMLANKHEMSKYLVDTNILIDFLRGSDSKCKDFILTNDDLTISYVTLGELVQGTRDSLELVRLRKFLNLFEVNWGSPEISSHACFLLGKYALSHRLMLLDALIASTALLGGYNLVTKNEKDFRFVKELKIINPNACVIT